MAGAVSFNSIRSAAQTMGTFTAPELAADLGISRATTQSHLDALVLEGMVRSLPGQFRRGSKGRPPQLYEFIRPDVPGQKASRPRRRPPEREVVELFGSIRPTRNTQTGSGRATRTGSTIVNGLIREVRKQGVEIRQTSHKVEYLKDGRVIASSSKTPGASSLKETRSHLRKAGIAA